MGTLTRQWSLGAGIVAAVLLMAAALTATTARAQEGGFSGDIPDEGVALVTFEGGSLDDLVAAATAEGFVSVFTTSEGEFVGYIIGAPDFVNAEFVALFEGEIAADTPFSVLVGEGGGTTPTATPTATGTPTADGTFEATLAPLNADVENVDDVAGTATFTIEGDVLTVTVSATGTAADLAHIQHIHALAECPTADADANGDGFVDVLEGLPAYGEVIIPIDSDIDDVAAGDAPMADADGAIEFTGTASVSALETAIGGSLNLAERAYVIHGVGDNVTLASTVGSLPGAPAAATLPIGCGEIDPAS